MLVIVAAVVVLVVQFSFKPQKHFICVLALIWSLNGEIMGGRPAGECSHTKAPCLSKGSGCLAVSGPCAEVETEAEAIRLGFHGRQSYKGVSNERPGWMRRVRGVSSSPAA